MLKDRRPFASTLDTTRTLLRNLLSEPIGPTHWHAMIGTRDFERVDMIEQVELDRPPHQRSMHEPAKVKDLPGKFRFRVEYEDSEKPHLVEISKEAFASFYARCTCKGFRFGGEICSHILRVANEEIVDRVSVPRSGKALHTTHQCPTCGQSKGDGSL